MTQWLSQWDYLLGKDPTLNITWSRPTRVNWAWKRARTGSTISRRWLLTTHSAGKCLLFSFFIYIWISAQEVIRYHFFHLYILISINLLVINRDFWLPILILYIKTMKLKLLKNKNFFNILSRYILDIWNILWRIHQDNFIF